MFCLDHGASVFDKVLWRAPNGSGRCSVAQCYDNAWAMLVHK